MTLTLTYDSQLARVQIQGTGYTDGYVTVERSINQLLWGTVRGGLIIAVAGGAFLLDDYEFTDGVENFYRVRPAIDVTFSSASDDQDFGDEYTVPSGVNELTFEAWAGGGAGTGDAPPNAQHSRAGGGGGSYARSTLVTFSSETLTLLVGAGGDRSGTQDAQNGGNSAVYRGESVLLNANGGGRSSGTATPGAGGDGALNVGTVVWSGGDGGAPESSSTSGGGGGGSATATADGGNGAAGAAGVGGAGGTGEGAGGAGGDTGVGADNGIRPGGGGGGQGDIQGISPIVPPSQSGSGADGQMRVYSWYGYPFSQPESFFESSITPHLEEVWLKSIRYPFLNRPVDCPSYGDITRPFRGGIFPVQGRSMPIAVTDLKGSRRWEMTIITRTLEEARDMDLILAANQVMFVHSPRESDDGCGPVSAVPGGYVAIGETVQKRAIAGSRGFFWTLPLTEVVQPAPEVVGTTLTWGTVFNLYGSDEAMLVSNPTWLDLYARVGSPDDLVVL